ncbi:Phosphatidylinositol-3,4,5-trisphosphate 3-phosphatase [Gossypium australe]|uniref:Phosphatidylinositol-3,4,5-trisphosphate 3-phosphatase n=1 Tax=Gossypium australe TaxID=47621 RepID=A0A5B6W308_9ROSI|nr:Phosphatidylinositol-3,4,5-trisphosphate 3-phosphatase [Gossypium australe]
MCALLTMMRSSCLLEGDFDLDLTYITENIMGFPAGDLSSGLVGFLEGRHKVYNLSERLYDASLFQGKVASFPFNDHNCPPLQLIKSFCQSAYSWLKEDIENVVVVHYKAGMGRTGLMICSLLLFLKLKRTSTTSTGKRCIDGRALVLPSQIRYVKYFERVLTCFSGEIQPGRRCMLRAIRLHKCPYWIRPPITISNHSVPSANTFQLQPEDLWVRTPKKGIVIFALPRRTGLAELTSDFKIHFHNPRGDFYWSVMFLCSILFCWLNTTMIENRMILEASDIDGFIKIGSPYPGFKIQLVMIDYEGMVETNCKANFANKGTEVATMITYSHGDKSLTQAGAGIGPMVSSHLSYPKSEQIGTSKDGTYQQSVKNQEPSFSNASKDIGNNGVNKASSGLQIPITESMGASDIKAMSADASSSVLEMKKILKVNDPSFFTNYDKI